MKPVVFMLARLFDTTSTLRCWASMPVAAIPSALIAGFPSWSFRSEERRSRGRTRRSSRVDLQHFADAIVLAVDHDPRLVVSAVQVDQPLHLDDRLTFEPSSIPCNSAGAATSCGASSLV